MKKTNNLISSLRFIGVLPISFIVYFISFVAVYFLGHFIDIMFSDIVSVFETTHYEIDLKNNGIFAASAISGGLFAYVGIIIAPTHKKIVSIILSVILGVNVIVGAITALVIHYDGADVFTIIISGVIQTIASMIVGDITVKKEISKTNVSTLRYKAKHEVLDGLEIDEEYESLPASKKQSVDESYRIYNDFGDRLQTEINLSKGGDIELQTDDITKGDKVLVNGDECIALTDGYDRVVFENIDGKRIIVTSDDVDNGKFTINIFKPIEEPLSSVSEKVEQDKSGVSEEEFISSLLRDKNNSINDEIALLEKKYKVSRLSERLSIIDRINELKRDAKSILEMYPRENAEVVAETAPIEEKVESSREVAEQSELSRIASEKAKSKGGATITEIPEDIQRMINSKSSPLIKKMIEK